MVKRLFKLSTFSICSAIHSEVAAYSKHSREKPEVPDPQGRPTYATDEACETSQLIERMAFKFLPYSRLLLYQELRTLTEHTSFYFVFFLGCRYTCSNNIADPPRKRKMRTYAD